MRVLESSLLVVNILVLAGCVLVSRMSLLSRGAAAAAVLLTALHFGFEGCRWQMVPGYLATGLLVMACAWPGALQLRFWATSGIVVCLVGAAVLGTILPVFSFPAPTGPFPIGSVIRHFIDPTREEHQSGRTREPRELMVQIWYPAEGTGERQFYRATTPPNLKNAHLRLVRLHSCGGVPVAGTRPRYPVLVFSPAWTGNCNQYTVLAEELASHGFIVVGIDHPYGSDPTSFPDGRVIRTTLHGWLDYSSDESLRASRLVAETQLSIRTADVRFVLDELQRLDRNDPDGLLTGRVDTLVVGAFGHSFGGAVAAEVCAIDERFLAGINFDGIVFGESCANGVLKPFLYVSDDSPVPTATELAKATGPHKRYLAHIAEDVRSVRRSLSENGGYWLKIRGASHMNFSDSPLYTPIKQITGAGSVNARRAFVIINEYARSFFEKHLLARDNCLLNQSYPRSDEVYFEAWPNRVDDLPREKQRALSQKQGTLTDE
jgi:predicted dienelactone hydrolase